MARFGAAHCRPGQAAWYPACSGESVSTSVDREAAISQWRPVVGLRGDSGRRPPHP